MVCVMQTSGVDAIIQRVRAYRRVAELSYSALALKAGLSRAALVGMDRKDWSPASSTLKSIEGLIPSDWREGDPRPTADGKRRKAA